MLSKLNLVMKMKMKLGFICNNSHQIFCNLIEVLCMSSMENKMECSTNEDDYHHLYAMQLASASVMPMVLKAVIELGLFEIIEKAGHAAMLSSEQIASQLPTQSNPDAPLMIDRILRLLVSYSILNCSSDTNNQVGQSHTLYYSLAPVAKYFIKNQDGGTMSPIFLTIQDKVIMDMWHHLKDAVLEGGKPFDKAHGIGAMEYIGKDARFREIFYGTLKGFNPLFIERFLKTYDGFQGLKSLVDVGGGDAFILNKIISKFPNIRGTNYDLAPVIEKGPSYPGIEHVAGDMFVSIPKGDAILMKNVIHGWSDEQCLKLLKNCYEALPGNGKVIVVDMVVPEIPEASAEDKSLMQFHLYFASVNPRGNERTERQFESLAKEAGFSHVRVACSPYIFSVIEFIKGI